MGLQSVGQGCAFSIVAFYVVCVVATTVYLFTHGDLTPYPLYLPNPPYPLPQAHGAPLMFTPLHSHQSPAALAGVDPVIDGPGEECMSGREAGVGEGGRGEAGVGKCSDCEGRMEEDARSMGFTLTAPHLLLGKLLAIPLAGSLDCILLF